MIGSRPSFCPSLLIRSCACHTAKAGTSGCSANWLTGYGLRSTTLARKEPACFGWWMATLPNQPSPSPSPGKRTKVCQLSTSNDWHDFEPRIGIAWDPFKNGRTSIRAGYGIFHDRLFGQLLGLTRGNPPYQVTSSPIVYVPLNRTEPLRSTIVRQPNPATPGSGRSKPRPY